MRLNAQTDFSLRIMMYLSAKRGRPATIREVATKLGLSQAHLMRIAAKLASKGLVHAARGRTGGLTLGRDANQITVEDVVTAIEPEFALVQCFQPNQARNCSIEPACLLKNVFASALRAFLAELRAVSVADLTQPNQVHLTEVFRLDEVLASREYRPRKGAGLPSKTTDLGPCEDAALQSCTKPS